MADKAASAKDDRRAGIRTLKGLRNWAILAVLIGCDLRRAEAIGPLSWYSESQFDVRSLSTQDLIVLVAA